MLITVSLIEDRFETVEQRAEREAICRTFLENLNRRIEMPQGEEQQQKPQKSIKGEQYDEI